MKRRYFGTDGVRGPYGGPVVNEAFARALAKAAAAWALKAGGGRVLVGRDTRASGAGLVAAVASGLADCVGAVTCLGILPTPAVSRAVRDSGAALGVMVTASHNPAADNGIKFFGPGGLKLSDRDEEEIEGLIEPTQAAPAADAAVDSSALEAYVSAAQGLLPAAALAGWRIAVDCANGATAATTPRVLSSLGARLVCMGDRPDGQNINRGCGSEHPAALAGLVKDSGSRLGIAHDGDGDRLVLCDETGSVLDGDEVLAILATHALAAKALVKDTLVVTVQSNLGLDEAVAAAGGRVVRSQVGDRYVAEAMRSVGATLGGESSGHVICSDFGPSGDGLAAALRVIRVMVETGRPLSELRKAMRLFPQRTGAVMVREKKPVETLPGLQAAIRQVEAELGSRGRVLVRYSGTEPKLRLLVEGPSDAVITPALARLEAAARADLGL